MLLALAGRSTRRDARASSRKVCVSVVSLLLRQLKHVACGSVITVTASGNLARSGNARPLLQGDCRISILLERLRSDQDVDDLTEAGAMEARRFIIDLSDVVELDGKLSCKVIKADTERASVKTINEDSWVREKVPTQRFSWGRCPPGTRPRQSSCGWQRACRTTLKPNTTMDHQRHEFAILGSECSSWLSVFSQWEHHNAGRRHRRSAMRRLYPAGHPRVHVGKQIMCMGPAQFTDGCIARFMRERGCAVV